jgi:hypothetical protein
VQTSLAEATQLPIPSPFSAQPRQLPSSAALTAVEEQSEINKLQDTLQRFAVQQSTERITCTIGYPGGSEAANVLYWSEHDIWIFSKKIENRYWNTFGIGKPVEGRSHSITCEINIPLSGVDRHIQGTFAVAEDGGVYLVHRGKIGGGTKGVGKSLLLEKYRGKLAQLTDSTGEVTAVPIGRLGDPRFALQISTFVREIDRLKQLVKSKRGFHPRKPKGFRKEFSGKRGYKITRDVSSDVNHGIIVNELARILNLRALDIDNDRRDLFIRNKRGQVTVLFEVKTNFDPFSIHSAIGQLYYYSVDEKHRPRLVAVLPQAIHSVIVRKLRKLDIEVLKYRFRPKQVTFMGLPNYA